MTARPIRVDPEVGLPDLVRQLTDDSKRLVRDEVQLAKLEAAEATRKAGHGTMWIGVAFGVGVVMMIALTVALVTGIGELANGNMWVGALTTGLVEVGLGIWLIKSGIAKFSEPSYSLEETRTEVKETARWVAESRR